MRKFILPFLLLFLTTVSSQTIVPKHTFNVELGLPVPLQNEPFKQIFHGLVNVSPNYQYCFENHLAFGAGIRYAHFTVNEFNITEEIHGGIHAFGAFVKVGHEKYHTNRFATDIGVKYGQSFNYISTDALKAMNASPERANSGFLEGTLGLILSADEFNSYRWIVSYAVYGFGFKPWQIGLTQNEGYDPAEFQRATHFLTFGFGYTYYIHKRTEGTE